jgi:hypothetical protein
MENAWSASTSGSDAGKESFAKTRLGYLAVEQEIVPLDGRADRASDDGSTKLRVMVRLRQGARHDVHGRHGGTFLKTLIF